jgi:HNH endonuclease
MSDAPSIERVRELFSYDPETGLITWAVRRCGVRCGSEAGTEHLGYRRVKVDAKLILAHRLAWAIHYGRWPAEEIDHINRNKSDNRIGNLREAARSDNMVNRAYPKGESGVTGVSKHKLGWQATVRINGKSVHLGLFKTIEEAAAVRAASEKTEYGQFVPKG